MDSIKLILLRCLLACLLVFTMTHYKAYSQTFDDEQIKVVYLVKFIKYLEWENENELNKLEIAVFHDDYKMIEILNALTDQLVIRNKHIKIKKIRNIRDDFSSQILFVGNNRNSEVEYYFKKIKGENILLVSDNYEQEEVVMINFFYDEAIKGINFELNTKNIEEQRIKIGSKLLLLGGKEIDVRKMYKQSQDSLKNARNELLVQQKKILLQKEEIDRQSQEIDKQKVLLSNLKSETVAQLEQIEDQKRTIGHLTSETKKQHEVLLQKLETINQHEKQISGQEQKITSQTKAILGREDILNKQILEIEQKEARIKEADVILDNQAIKIKDQQNVIYIILFLALLLLAVAYLFYKNYKTKKRANEMLVRKNQEINQQKEELQTQADYISTVNSTLRIKNEEITTQSERIEEANSLLMHKNESIKSSITYAQTIQQAILPTKEKLDKWFDNFILFKPKDIVSGDFYWFQHFEDKNNTKKVIVAVVDCTGHGVPGAFMTMIGNTLLNTIIIEHKIHDPARILTLLNKNIGSSLHQDTSANDDGMDVCLCCFEKLDNDQWKLTFEGAKRDLVWWCSEKQKLIFIKGTRSTIGGKMRHKIKRTYSNKNIILNQNDCIYLFSDGLTDQNNQHRKTFGVERLMKIFTENAQLDIVVQEEAIKRHLADFMQDEAQRDDIAMIGIKI